MLELKAAAAAACLGHARETHPVRWRRVARKLPHTERERARWRERESERGECATRLEAKGKHKTDVFQGKARGGCRGGAGTTVCGRQKRNNELVGRLEVGNRACVLRMPTQQQPVALAVDVAASIAVAVSTKQTMSRQLASRQQPVSVARALCGTFNLHSLAPCALCPPPFLLLVKLLFALHSPQQQQPKNLRQCGAKLTLPCGCFHAPREPTPT